MADAKWKRKINSNPYAKWSGMYGSISYLSHHGVKGMKWGVRRYQNPDGTLTDKGRKRLAKLIRKDEDIIEKDSVLRNKIISPELSKASKQAAQLKKVSDAFYNSDEKTRAKYRAKAAQAFAKSSFAKEEGLSLQDVMDLYNNYDGDQGHYNSFRYYLDDHYKGGSKAYGKKTIKVGRNFDTEVRKSVDNLLQNYGDIVVNKNTNKKIRNVAIDAIERYMNYDIDYLDD